jgi:hypothetical protein
MLISTVTKEYRTILPTLVHLIWMGKDLGHVLGSATQLRVLGLQQRPIVRCGSDRET